MATAIYFLPYPVYFSQQMDKNLNDMFIFHQQIAFAILPKTICMRTITFALSFCLALLSATAQQHQLDSLEKELRKHPVEDTARLKILNDIAFDYYQANPQKGLAFADEQIGLAQKLKNQLLFGKAYFNKGINYWQLGQYHEALEVYAAAVAIFEKEGLVKNVAKVNNSIGVVYQSLSDYPGALKIYFKNLQLYEKIKDSLMIGMTYGNIGLVYNHLGQNNKAIEYHTKAIAINEQKGNKKELADNYANLGNVYDDGNEPAKAVTYYQKALAISQSINYTKNIASDYANLGIAYTTQGNFREGYQYSLKALSFYKASGNTQNMAVVLMSVGDIYLSAQESFFIEEKINEKKRYVYARQYFDSSLKLYTDIEDVAGQAEAWEKLSAVYTKQNNFKESLQAYKKFTALKDSILNDEKKEEITRLEMNYGFAKKEDSLKTANEKKALLASAEIKSESTIKKSIAWGSGILLSAALVSFIFYKKRRDAKQKQTEAEFKTEVADTEMKALRAQMNPHFIFNSLNSISDYIAKNDVPLADKYLSKFAKLMRMILENSEQKDVPLADDLKALELYMQLEALRMNNKFSYEIKVDDTIDKGNTMIPPLILQPFVENSIWHGIAKKEGPGKILIHIKKEGDDMINCMVEDDGVGRKQSALVKTTTAQTEKTSLGMKITQSRIDILNKIKNTKAAVQLSDLAQGMRVEVKLPLATNF